MTSIHFLPFGKSSGSDLNTEEILSVGLWSVADLSFITGFANY